MTIKQTISPVLFIVVCMISSCLLHAQDKPNIIFVLADDMGYSDLSCYGNPVIKTPFLDKMSHEGALATNYVVSSPSCTPSRASLLTGRYASRMNLPYPIGPGSSLGLPDNEVTMAEMLKSAGFATGMVGKWHLGDHLPYHHPTAQGFDFFYGMLYSQDYRHPYVKTDTTIKIFRNRTPEIIRPADSILTRVYTNEAIKYIQQQKKGKPFFLYLAHNMPHLPVAFASTAKNKNRSAGGPLGDVVEELDESLAALWNAVKEQGLDDNTIFFFSSDNGPWIDFPSRMADDGATKPWHAGTAGVFRGKKGETYEGGLREPLIVYWKGHIRPGTVITDVMSNLDVLPTIAEWTGSPLPAGRTLDGQSVTHLLTGKAGAHPAHREIYYVNNGICEAVRTGEWKYRFTKARQGDGINSKFKEANEELFNLDYDPSERTNLLHEFPGKAAELKNLFEKFPGAKEN